MHFLINRANFLQLHASLSSFWENHSIFFNLLYNIDQKNVKARGWRGLLGHVEQWSIVSLKAAVNTPVEKRALSVMCRRASSKQQRPGESAGGTLLFRTLLRIRTVFVNSSNKLAASEIFTCSNDAEIESLSVCGKNELCCFSTAHAWMNERWESESAVRWIPAPLSKNRRRASQQRISMGWKISVMKYLHVIGMRREAYLHCRVAKIYSYWHI